MNTKERNAEFIKGFHDLITKFVGYEITEITPWGLQKEPPVVELTKEEEANLADLWLLTVTNPVFHAYDKKMRMSRERSTIEKIMKDVCRIMDKKRDELLTETLLEEANNILNQGK